jgi:putative phosphoribosyl transferase
MTRDVDQFRDRVDAGRRLAELLTSYRDEPDTIVLGLPRGGVPVAAQIAEALHLPLDVLIVRKLGVPGFSEVAFGAIASGGIEVLNPDVIRSSHIDDAAIDDVRTAQFNELKRREFAYRGERPPLDVTDTAVIVVDDGTATGATMRAAVEALRAAGPRRIVVAIGVSPPDVVERLSQVANEVVAVLTPRNFMAVGAWYDDFAQTTDDEVIAALQNQEPGTKSQDG